jgi:hypothetical protein
MPVTWCASSLEKPFDFSGFPRHDPANRSRSQAFTGFASHLPVFRRQTFWRSLDDLRKVTGRSTISWNGTPETRTQGKPGSVPGSPAGPQSPCRASEPPHVEPEPWMAPDKEVDTGRGGGHRTRRWTPDEEDEPNEGGGGNRKPDLGKPGHQTREAVVPQDCRD